MMRIVFMGTPDFAVPSLNQLIQDGHEIVGVYTQPDKPKNRGMKLTPPPVKVVAQANHCLLYTSVRWSSWTPTTSSSLPFSPTPWRPDRMERKLWKRRSNHD